MSTSEQLASAAASGIAAAHAHIQRLDKDAALAEIEASLSQYRIAPERRCAVLSEAAAAYTRARPTVDWWHPAALEFLIEAGADRDQARKIAAARHPGLLGRG